jgi:Bacterial TSP3 repeat
LHQSIPVLAATGAGAARDMGGYVTISQVRQAVTVFVKGITRRFSQFPPYLLLTTLAICFGASQIATAFFQVPDEPSPENGTAQVVAQGVFNIVGDDLQWQIAERTAAPPANASTIESATGFLIVDSGVLLVEDLATGEQQRLPAGEAMRTTAGPEQIRAALGSGSAVYWELALVDAPEEDPAEGVVFTGEPFAGPGARHDIDLLQDALGPGGTTAVPAGALPTLVLILDGVAEIATDTGDVFSLGAGEAIALSGPLVLTATENGASVAALYTGPAMPRLADQQGTPVPNRRVIASPGAQTPEATVAPAAATATVEQTAEVDDDADGDADGLSGQEEVAAGTDANLSDTDEDGLTDGQEVGQIGTSPLVADTDGDGVLDGDEVAQATDPLDGITDVAAGESPALEEPVAAEEPADVEVAVAPGDSDGDGLEDALETDLGTDPFDLDTDDDGLTDGDEYYVYATGTRNPDSDGDVPC